MNERYPIVLEVVYTKIIISERDEIIKGKNLKMKSYPSLEALDDCVGVINSLVNLFYFLDGFVVWMLAAGPQLLAAFLWQLCMT